MIELLIVRIVRPQLEEGGVVGLDDRIIDCEDFTVTAGETWSCGT